MLAADGRIVRGRPRGTWASSQQPVDLVAGGGMAAQRDAAARGGRPQPQPPGPAPDRTPTRLDRVEGIDALLDAYPDVNLQRFTGRRELLPETINAIAGLVSDKSAGLTW